ncbi:MAG: hypothetical protein H6Q75_1457 [Firmicutes bacterium]|nr:hypothetical protein [Bacillota bacterium]
MNWWQLVKRELYLMFRKDFRRVNFIFGASLAYLIIFGLLYGTHVITNVPLVIYDEDQTQLSRSLVQCFADSERFEIVAQPSSQEEMEYYLHEQTAYAAVHIPHDFASHVTSDKSSPVLLIASGINLAVTNTITTYTQEILAAFNQHVSTKLLEAAGVPETLASHKSAPITFAIRVLNNPTLSYLNFFVIGLAMAAFQQGIFLAVGASILYEYRNRDELAAIHPVKVMTAKMLPYFILASLSFFVTLYASIRLFDIPCKGTLLDLFFLSETFVLTAIGFSSLVASLCHSEITFTKLSLTYSIPAFTLSGYIWPLASMDAFSQTIAYIFPLFYLSDALRDLLLGGYSPELTRNITVLLVLGLVLTCLATWLYTKRRHTVNTSDPTGTVTA